MNKILLIGKQRYFGYALIAVQGLLLILIAIFFINRSYMEAWQNYPQDNTAAVIYLKNISVDRQADTERYLMDSAGELQLFLVRQDTALDGEGYYDGLKIGVYGDYTHNGTDFSFMGRQIIDNKQLQSLLCSDNPESTLGIETGSINSVGEIPCFRFYEKVVIKQLSSLISDSCTVNGVYSVVGLDQQNENEFLCGLSEVSGISQEELSEQSSGAVFDRDFKRDILFVFLGAQIFLNIVFFLVLAVRSLNKEGKLVLLGWSQTAFAKATLGRFFIAAIIFIPLLLCAGWILAGWNRISLALIGYLFIAVIINLLVLGVELALAASIILIIRPLDAMRGRLPKKPLYVFGILAYIFISVATVFCGIYVDRPFAQLTENARLSEYWQGVSNYQILKGISVGQDSESIRGQSNKLNYDFYNWYSGIADEEGVYLINTEYYNEGIINDWRDNLVYEAVPDQPFWYFAVSPNYLSLLGVKAAEAALASAQEGTRLYLLPDTLSSEQRRQMQAYLMESSTKSIAEGDIPTAFSKERNFEFLTYQPQKQMFTWAVKPDMSMSAAAPVIYVCTPQNMRYFENESLKVTGLDGYIKFADAKTAEKYIRSEVFGQFDLTDNAPVVTGVQNYIDGLQKDIWTAICWFGLAFAVLVAILIGLLITLATIFRMVNQEKINVKKFLGFNFRQLYQTPLCLLAAVIFAEITVMLLLRSKFGLLLMVIVALLQIIIFAGYMTRGEFKRLLTAFKGGE